MPEIHNASIIEPLTDQERAVRSVLRRASAVPLILVALFLTIVLWQLNVRLTDSRWVDHTDLVIATADSTSLHLADAASNVRGFLLVGEDYLLDRYRHSFQSATSNLEQLESLVTDNPQEMARLNAIKTLLRQWNDFISQEVALKRAGGDYQAVLRSRATVNRMDSITDQMSTFILVERELRDRRSAVLNRGIFTSVLLIVFGALAIGGLLVLLGRRDVETVAQVFRATLQQEAAARRFAEEASRSRGQFLNTVSHELRNPLNSVLMWVRALQTDSADPERQKRGLEAIERGARAQAQLVEDLIDTARIDSGKLRLDVRPVDPAQVVQAAIDIVSLSAEAKGIRIQSMLDANAGRVAGDAQRLQQVFWNLLSNAIKFTPKGGRVQVRLERINSHLEVSVSDTGCGIDPIQLPKIFGQFWQADAAAARANHGLGLGLSIARHITELHGGTITAFSDGVGQGSTFRVRLPIMISSELPTAIRRHPTAVGTDASTSRFRLDGVSVLSIDDEPDASLAVQALLGAVGADVRVAHSAEEALMMLDSFVPDVIISDIGMPGFDGLTLIREIRRKSQPVSEIPAIALTAYGRVDDKVSILEAGYQAHVIKPVDASELMAVVASLTRGRDDHHSR